MVLSSTTGWPKRAIAAGCTTCSSQRLTAEYIGQVSVPSWLSLVRKLPGRGVKKFVGRRVRDCEAEAKAASLTAKADTLIGWSRRSSPAPRGPARS